jgi:hypothetical protein
MYTKILGFTATLLSSAALLAFSGGCSSAHSPPMRMTHSGHDPASVTPRSESRSYDRQNPSNRRDDGRRMHAADADSQNRLDSESPANDHRYTPAPDRMATTVASHNDRVTVVSTEQPPLQKLETPLHPINYQDEFWVGGHWVMATSGFSWEAGRIERYRPGSLFGPATWAPSQRGWEFTPEYWD